MMVGLDQVADVYVETVADGTMTTLVKIGLRCRFEHVGGGQTSQSRSEMSEIRVFAWDPDYVLPDYCRIVRDGISYTPIPSSYKAFRGASGLVARRICDVQEMRA